MIMERTTLRRQVEKKFGTCAKMGISMGHKNGRQIELFIACNGEPESEHAKQMAAALEWKGSLEELFKIETGVEEVTKSKDTFLPSLIDEKLKTLTPIVTKNGFIVKCRKISKSSHPENQVNGLVMFPSIPYIVFTGLNADTIKDKVMLINGIPALMQSDAYSYHTPSIINGELCVTIISHCSDKTMINYGNPVAEVIILNK